VSSINQDVHRRQLLAETQAIDARLAAIVTGLDAVRRDATPSAGGWSVNQVLEHLCVSHEGYLVPMRALIDAPDAPRADPARAEWKPTLLGGLLANSLRSTRRLPAPRKFQPGPEPRPRVMEAFLGDQREVAELLERAAGLDWRRIRMRSPVSSLVGMNLGDAFTVLVVHAARHLGQIERIAGLPSASVSSAVT
jgi:hypothetical protein